MIAQFFCNSIQRLSLNYIDFLSKEIKSLKFERGKKVGNFTIENDCKFKIMLIADFVINAIRMR